MKKLLMFSLVAAALLAACQPKDANTTAAATTTTASPVTDAAAVPKPKFITATHELKTVKCETPLNFPFVKSLSNGDAAALAKLQANLSELYFGQRISEAQISKELAARCANDEASPATSRNELLFNQDFLSIESQLNADMDPTEHYVFDLSTGEVVELKKMLDPAKLKQEILAASPAVKAAKKASPSSKIELKIQTAWLIPDGISIDIFIELTPDDEYYCDGDECFLTYDLPMAKAKEIAVQGSRLAAVLANF
jgi:hypothetical protein